VLVLALDTSCAATTVAVMTVDATGPGDASVLATRINVDARAHGEVLMPSIQACLLEAHADVSDLTAIVAGIGPGPYTGLRIGLVTAAVLADALNIAAYGVCSLDGIGGALAATPRLLVAADARRREVYWGAYSAGRRDGGPGVAKPADVATTGFDGCAGAGARLYADVLGLPVLDQDYPDPAALVRAAVERIRTGGASEALTPLYLRQPDAVVPAAAKSVLT
jgi:tRNA threonylcarbamoyl adenosine modification protein YeaZ